MLQDVRHHLTAVLAATTVAALASTLSAEPLHVDPIRGRAGAGVRAVTVIKAPGVKAGAGRAGAAAKAEHRHPHRHPKPAPKALPKPQPAPKPKPAPKPQPAPKAAPEAPTAPQTPADACQAAIARNRTPLPPGVTERCASPYYHWGTTNGRSTIWYHPGKIAKETGGRAWDYTVAHERSHAILYAEGGPWTCEPCADDRAARYYPKAVARWSPYR